MSRAAPPGLIRPDTDPIRGSVPLDGSTGTVHRAVPFAVRAGYRPLELDLYLPAATEPVPVIVFLHGGGWRLGTRAVFCPTWHDWSPDPFTRLVAEGFAVASVDYRLSGEAIFPAQLHDVQAAVRWLRTRAGELGLDTTKMVVWGESAGGHLASMLGLTHGVEELDDPAADDGQSSAVAAVIDWYGPANLTSMDDQALPNAVAVVGSADSRESMLIGSAVADSTGSARRASPISYVHAGAPPFHIAHGEADRFVPAAQSVELGAALEKAGVEVELNLIAGADHLWGNAPDPEGLFEAAVAFAKRMVGAGR